MVHFEFLKFVTNSTPPPPPPTQFKKFERTHKTFYKNSINYKKSF